MRFFVLSCAVAKKAKVGISNFHFYNAAGQSSSLSPVNPKEGHSIFTNRTAYNPSEVYGPGQSAIDFVPTITLDMILASIPDHITIEMLKVDAQGYDLEIIKSAHQDRLRKIPRIYSEVFMPLRENDYLNISNGYNEWLKYMKTVGCTLLNVPKNPLLGSFLDAKWELQKGV